MAELTPSPLAPAQFPDLPPLAGIKLATAATGLKYKGRDDLFLIMADEGSSFAGVFTKVPQLPRLCMYRVRGLKRAGPGCADQRR